MTDNGSFADVNATSTCIIVNYVCRRANLLFALQSSEDVIWLPRVFRLFLSHDNTKQTSLLSEAMQSVLYCQLDAEQ